MNTDSDDVLRVLISTAPDRETALHPDKEYQYGEHTSRENLWARFADEFLSKGMEFGVVDADQHFGSERWLEAVEDEWPNDTDDDPDRAGWNFSD